jgi:hypothetical protein
MKELTKEQQKELEILAAEIEAEAIQMKLDYEKNPTPLEESGSVVMVHENSEWLNIAQDIDESDKDKPIVWDEEE